jgi:hypothetical protein
MTLTLEAEQSLEILKGIAEQNTKIRQLEDENKRLTEAKGECRWTFEDDSYYETDCNESFYFDDGLRLEDCDNFKYCPYCGGKIKALKGERYG